MSFPPLSAFYRKDADRLLLWAVTSWSTSGMYQAIKRFMGSCAAGMKLGDAAVLRRASVPWLRHPHGSHAVNGRSGRTPVGVHIVRNNLGHASISTTSGYLSTERDQRVQAMEGFWGVANES